MKSGLRLEAVGAALRFGSRVKQAARQVLMLHWLLVSDK